MRRVLIVDDHPVVRQGLSRILAMGIPDVELLEASTGDEAVERLQREDCHLAILDLAMPGESGLSLLRRVKTVAPQTPALIVSMYPLDQFARRALQAGAAGYISKASDLADVVKAAQTLLAGRTVPPPDVDMRANDAPHDLLSDREYQVLRLIAAGHPVSAIADLLCLSVKTVSTYRARILEKMNMRNNAELMRYALEKSLLDPP